MQKTREHLGGIMPMDKAAPLRGGAVLVAAVAAAAVLTAPAVGDEAEARGGKAAETRQIASSVLDAEQDVKFTLTAVRSADDPLMASVRLKAFARQHGRFVLTDEVRVGAVDGWFWFPVTGRGAVCEFSTASTDPAPLAVSLLITPSIGCSAPERFELRDGRFGGGDRGARTPHGGVRTGGGGLAGRAAAPPERT
ncbi:MULTISPECIES: hypothetical protein [Streptomyces]|nr:MULTISPECIES: hypothetical protein [Streptomyces]QKW00554.1 hypothetical protein HUT14_12065 [Streptomyces sp. NA02536]